MLYTSYINKLKILPKDITKIIIMRYLPKWINIKSYDNLFYDKHFSPSENILNNYNNSKKTIDDWNIFKDNFNNELLKRKDLNDNIEKLARLLIKKDIIILCCEKDYNHCHRKLIAEYINNKYNIPWLEYT